MIEIVVIRHVLAVAARGVGKLRRDQECWTAMLLPKCIRERDYLLLKSRIEGRRRRFHQHERHHEPERRFISSRLNRW